MIANLSCINLEGNCIKIYIFRFTVLMVKVLTQWRSCCMLMEHFQETLHHCWTISRTCSVMIRSWWWVMEMEQSTSEAWERVSSGVENKTSQFIMRCSQESIILICWKLMKLSSILLILFPLLIIISKSSVININPKFYKEATKES